MGDYAILTNNTEQKPGAEMQFSINITQEALRIGKIPTEEVAKNIALGRYNKQGVFKDGANQTQYSPRV